MRTRSPTLKSRHDSFTRPRILDQRFLCPKLYPPLPPAAETPSSSVARNLSTPLPSYPATGVFPRAPRAAKLAPAHLRHVFPPRPATTVQPSAFHTGRTAVPAPRVSPAALSHQTAAASSRRSPGPGAYRNQERNERGVMRNRHSARQCGLQTIVCLCPACLPLSRQHDLLLEAERHPAATVLRAHGIDDVLVDRGVVDEPLRDH